MDLIRVYYQARDTCLQMFRDRGYTVPDGLDITLEEFRIAYEQNRMDQTVHSVTDEEGRSVVMKFLDPSPKTSLNKAELDQILKQVGLEGPEDHSLRLIILYNAQKTVSKLESDYMSHPTIEILQAHLWSINPKNNIYQPEWRLIRSPSEEANQIYERFAPSVLASVCLDDPMNRYYAGRPAGPQRLPDLYQITRNGTGIAYRKVISSRMNVKKR